MQHLVKWLSGLVHLGVWEHCVSLETGSASRRSGSTLTYRVSAAVGQAPFALPRVGRARALLHAPAVEQLLQRSRQGGVRELVAGGDAHAAKHRCVSYPPEVADLPQLEQQRVLVGQLAARARWPGRRGSARSRVAGSI